MNPSDETRPPHPPELIDCDAVRAALDVAWLDIPRADAWFDPVIVQGTKGAYAPGGATEQSARLVSRAELEAHLAVCPECLERARWLEEFDTRMRDAMRAWERSVPSPGEDRIAAILRSAIDPPEAVTIRRIRGSLQPILWMTFLFLSLLGALAILALAYKGMLFHH